MRVSFEAVRAKEPSWDGSACSVKVQGLFASMGKSKKAYGMEISWAGFTFM